MLSLTDLSTILILIILISYGSFIALRNYVFGEGTLRDSESIHRFLLFGSGVLVGLGFTGFHDFETIFDLSNEFFLGILFILAGLFMFAYGSIYLKNVLWDPMVLISEFSAEFGESFIATRLPIVGGRELQSFSERFNKNARTLADKISRIEIHLDKLSDVSDETIQQGNELVSEIRNLEDIALNYGEFARDQKNKVVEIENEINSFVSWYENTKDTLTENFIELRSLSELGNLIAVNAAIEASNLEEPNPGLSTLAEKLHDLAQSLEERQESMRRLIDEVNIRYSEFKTTIKKDVEDATIVASNTNELNDQVDELVRSVGQNEVLFNDYTREWERAMDQFKENLPRAY